MINFIHPETRDRYDQGENKNILYHWRLMAVLYYRHQEVCLKKKPLTI